MPHPEHAVDELTGSTDGLRLFGSLAATSRRSRRDGGRTPDARPRREALGPDRAEFERIVELLGREPNELELAVFSLLWSRALRLQALEEAAAEAARPRASGC